MIIALQTGSWRHAHTCQVAAGEEQGRPESEQAGLRGGKHLQGRVHVQDQGGCQGRGQCQEDSLLQMERLTLNQSEIKITYFARCTINTNN